MLFLCSRYCIVCYIVHNKYNHYQCFYLFSSYLKNSSTNITDINPVTGTVTY